MSKHFHNTAHSIMQMDMLTLAPMPVKKWWTRVSRHEHACLMHNGYIKTLPVRGVWCVKLTNSGKRRLEQ